MSFFGWFPGFQWSYLTFASDCDILYIKESRLVSAVTLNQSLSMRTEKENTMTKTIYTTYLVELIKTGEIKYVGKAVDFEK